MIEAQPHGRRPDLDARYGVRAGRHAVARISYFNDQLFSRVDAAVNQLNSTLGISGEQRAIAALLSIMHVTGDARRWRTGEIRYLQRQGQVVADARGALLIDTHREIRQAKLFDTKQPAALGAQRPHAITQGDGVGQRHIHRKCAERPGGHAHGGELSLIERQLQRVRKPCRGHLGPILKTAQDPAQMRCFAGPI